MRTHAAQGAIRTFLSFAVVVLIGAGIQRPVQGQHCDGPLSASSGCAATGDRHGGGLSDGPHPLVFSGTSTAAAGPEYEAGPLRRFFFGDQYRKAWSEAIQVPTLDMDATSGGLSVTGSAGGLQSILLFLAGEDGRHYVLRKLEKNAGDALPEGTQGTIVEDIAQDQISSLHPYGAFVVPRLAAAAGLLYTHPVLVRVPDSPRLGEHRSEFAGNLALLERNVVEDVSDEERFGFTEEVVDTEDLIERIQSGPDHYVDQQSYITLRLFDILIGDRDRHDEQYFWAGFEEDGRTRYVPIPIDRDWAFARYDGLMLRAGRKVGGISLKKLTNFSGEIENIIGLNHQGAKLDYMFTSELRLADWIEAARLLQNEITDELIEDALRVWPAAVMEDAGETTIRNLKARRDELDEAAQEYYEVIARRVDVIGTNEAERFTVSRTGPATVEVAITQNDGSTTFRRIFDEDETEEIRLYALGGDDRMIIQGNEKGAIVIRAVGGAGRDVFRDESTSDYGFIHYYDTSLDDVQGGAETRQLTDSLSNSYEMHRYELNTIAPIASFDYDSDQGIFIGAGARMIRHGFKKEPYAARHELEANYAPRSRGYNIDYDGHLVDFWNEWDADIEADVLAEDIFRDFYGFGNETPESARELFDARFRWITASPALERSFGRLTSLRIGPYFEFARIKPPKGQSVSDPSVGFTRDELADRYVVGLRSRFEIDGRDSTMVPRFGVHWIAEAGGHSEVSGSGVRYARFASQLSAYQSLGPLTLALRAGGATNVGDFVFYQSSFLGGDRNLRGFNDHRFAGRTSAYGNAELRLHLGQFNIYLTRGHLGVLGFVDAGRVWWDGESSDVWHQGYGAGLWVTPFDRFLVNGTLGFSEDGSVFDLSFELFF